MSSIDIRNEDSEEVTEIVFAEKYSSRDGHETSAIAFKLTNQIFVYIEDGSESLRIESKEHAQNLIKALNKAIELGWVK